MERQNSKPESSMIVIQIEADPALLREASQILEEMGLTLSEATHMMLMKIARDRRLPFGCDHCADMGHVSRETLLKLKRGEDLRQTGELEEILRYLERWL